ncbi:MAG: hypothetical protein O9267_01545 [Flavobacterium sp.]|jgi:hypothetical protein|uniref:hypothetical protein n=1 Tax=Flavobacterium sp. TaxID=239 RepID=UPI0022C10106|nr:hypothetical protein [Flavobacterium sp.]MCZ8196273.1 hypothetical protein [Flavobacterium sp.]
MKTPDERGVLMQKIIALQHQQAQELIVLKEQLKLTYESVRPLNFLKATLHDMTTSPQVKTDLVSGAVNMTSFLLSKNPVLSTFQQPIKKVVATVLKFVFKKFISPK